MGSQENVQNIAIDLLSQLLYMGLHYGNKFVLSKKRASIKGDMKGWEWGKFDQGGQAQGGMIPITFENWDK